MIENFSLEQALMAELQKDVKLKGGQVAVDENGNPLKAFDAIAKSIMNNAMKGDIAAVNFIRNLTKSNDPDAQQKREKLAAEKLSAQMARMQKELEDDGLWLGQEMEIEQLAQNWLIIDSLNRQMQTEDYQDVLTEFRKDGSINIRINPLHEWRDKYQKQFLNDWKMLRMEASDRVMVMKHKPTK